MPLKTSAYGKSCNRQTKWMYYLIEDNNFLQKDNTVWDKFSKFDRKLVYNKTVLKTKRKPCGDKVTGFYDKEIPKVDSNHACLAVISLDSALKKD